MFAHISSAASSPLDVNFVLSYWCAPHNMLLLNDDCRTAVDTDVHTANMTALIELDPAVLAAFYHMIGLAEELEENDSACIKPHFRHVRVMVSTRTHISYCSRSCCSPVGCYGRRQW
jgi:hypothetical protein